jgi:hypothetical protein
MADFCRHCSISLWGKDTKDLADLGPAADDEGRPWFYTVLCETCGPIQVDAKGARVSPLDEQDLKNGHLMIGQFVDQLATPP